ncbi:PIN domain-containing protein [Aporhodopirellula aestuarii]|uniref:PIN domain-containing protein n=1 Tax=Aporhodopirellula aestuarii TaxID=2950107 RepID=A0ABT0UAZ5_9BACT|nr:PIN domain-containing protein [Aporhodopirellula aestuarii]MCM2373496.1 PIN domain-containing protein [Aporhodopirellula aestuarii]
MKHRENDRLSSNPTRVLLIDLDNCPHEVLDLAATAKRYDLIIAAHGRQEPRVPLGMASVLGSLISQRKIEIWAMPAGKNSADFGLTFIAGRLSAELPKDAIFEVASKDKDLEHAVGLLNRSGFEASRIDSSINSTYQASPQAVVSPLASRIASSLSGRGAKSRPKRRRSLHATVKARGPSPEQGMAALKELEQVAAIIYDSSGSPQYDDALLKSLAALAPKKKCKTEALPLKKLVPPKRLPRHVDPSQLTLFDREETLADDGLNEAVPLKVLHPEIVPGYSAADDEVPF